MITLLRAETSGNYDNYFFTERSPLSTKDITITIDFVDNEITGDCVAYGGWFDLELEDCLRYLDQVDNSEIIRDFKFML